MNVFVYYSFWLTLVTVLVLKALQESFGCESDVVLPKVPVMTEKLWVDKYAPNSFMELLSDEQTNREVTIYLEMYMSFEYWCWDLAFLLMLIILPMCRSSCG